VDSINISYRDRKGWYGLDLAQDRDMLSAFVNTVLNPVVPQTAGNFLSSCATASLERLGATELVRKLQYAGTHSNLNAS
jgi:hypothetical protein